MSSLAPLAKFLILAGAFIMFFGLLLFAAGKIPGVGKLPGDILIQKKNFTFYFPIVTSLLLSIFLTLILSLLLRRR